MVSRWALAPARLVLEGDRAVQQVQGEALLEVRALDPAAYPAVLWARLPVRVVVGLQGLPAA